MKKTYISILCLMLLTFLSQPAQSEEKLGIIATVGNQAITNQDMLHRLKILIMSRGGKGDPATVKRLQPEALKELIDERIFVEQAEKLNYKVTDKQIQEAIAALEKQNNMPAGGLLGMMQANDVPIEAMNQKIKAEICYAFLVAREVTPKITITDDEVLDFIKAENQVSTRDEFFIREIVLPVNTSADEAANLQLARELKDKLVAGQDFAALAKKYSKSPSAANGGNVGWMDAKQIPQEILSIVKQQGLAKVLGPIKSIEGYYLVIANEHRVISTKNDNDLVELRQFSQMPKAQKEVDPITSKLLSLNNVGEACLRPEAYAKANAIDLKNYGRVRAGDLPSGVQNVLATLSTATFSKPINTPFGVTSFIVCERAENTATEPTEEEKEKARNILKLRRTDLAAKKYVRTLHQKTNIDVRL